MKHQRRSAEEIQTLCTRFRESGLTQRQFSEEIGVCVGSLQRWLKRQGQNGLTRNPRFVEALPIHTAQEVRECRIELPAGIRVVCRELPTTEYLVGLVQRLQAP